LQQSWIDAARKSGIIFGNMNFFGQSAIYSFFDHQGVTRILTEVAAGSSSSAPLDLSIEGMRSQQFSNGVFVFMLVTILFFAAIVYAVTFGKHAPKTQRIGEKLMLGAIMLGIVAAIIFGALQMLSGVLF
jgi:hypothetical protein